jgi:hypothetical protein
MDFYVFALFLWTVLLQKVGPLVLVVIPFLVLAVIYSLYKYKSITYSFFLLVCAYGYLLFSGFIFGGVNLQTLVNPEFYTTDGRVLFYYLPLLLGSIVQINPNKIDKYIRLLVVICLFILFLNALWLVGLFKDQLGGYLFTGLIDHKTSAGAYFSLLAIFFIIYGAYVRNRNLIILGIIMFVPVLLSGSRQVLLSIASLSVYFAIKYKLDVRYFAAMALGFAALFAMPSIAPNSYERISRIFEGTPLRAVEEQWQLEGYDPSEDLALQLNLSAGGEWNLVGRILFYKRAVDLFWESPIFGIGFGRYNDPLTECALQLGKLLCVMEASDTYFLEKNAHNSYLQYLSELGIIGFVLFLILWIVIFFGIRRGIRLSTQNSQKKTEAYFQACEAVFFTLPVSALFGHAYGAPQVGIPILSVIGIGLGFVNFMSWRRD